MVPSSYTGGIFMAPIHVYWGGTYRIEDVKNSEGKVETLF
jgi:hypothetical protein